MPNLRKIWNDICCFAAEKDAGFTPEPVQNHLRAQGWRVKTVYEFIHADRWGSAVIGKTTITAPDGRSSDTDKAVAADYETRRRQMVRDWFARQPV